MPTGELDESLLHEVRKAGGPMWIAQSTDCEKPIVTPTEEVYGALQEAYSIFNDRLFGGRLPDCVITLQRAAGSYGYFCSQRFISRDGKQSDEIALNPSHFAERTDKGVLSTLGHEMAHLDQFHFGKPNAPAGCWKCQLAMPRSGGRS